MTAQEAAELISPQVNLNVERDRDKVFSLLTLVNNKAWKEGSWWGMNKHFHVDVKKDHEGYYYFIAPNGYDTLQAANFNGQPVGIKDKWFQFHKNGNGSIEKCLGDNWITDIQDLGEVPVIIQPRACYTKVVKIGARSIGLETDPVKVYINGTDVDGNRVTTFVRKDDGNPDPILGAVLAVSEEIRVIDNIDWGRIDSISKDVSINPVEVYAIHCDGSMQILTRLNAEDRESKLRKYLVPDSCGGAKSVHGIFKISKPRPIVYGSQKMIISDEEALLSLSISMDYLFNKKAPEESLPYTANGVKSLEDDNKRHETPTSQPIQVEGVEDYGFLQESNY